MDDVSQIMAVHALSCVHAHLRLVSMRERLDQANSSNQETYETGAGLSRHATDALGMSHPFGAVDFSVYQKMRAQQKEAESMPFPPPAATETDTIVSPFLSAVENTKQRGPAKATSPPAAAAVSAVASLSIVVSGAGDQSTTSSRMSSAPGTPSVSLAGHPDSPNLPSFTLAYTPSDQSSVLDAVIRELPLLQQLVASHNASWGRLIGPTLFTLSVTWASAMGTLPYWQQVLYFLFIQSCEILFVFINTFHRQVISSFTWPSVFAWGGFAASSAAASLFFVLAPAALVSRLFFQSFCCLATHS